MGDALALGRHAGNRAFAAALRRQAAPPAAPPAAAPPAGGDAGARAGDGPEPYRTLILEHDITGIKTAKNFSGATRPQRFAMIEILVNQGWVGPLDEYAIEDLWNGFGAAGIAQAYAERRALWDQCVEAGAELWDLEAVKPVRDKWESDVKAVARVYMRHNREAVLAEAARVGLGDLKGGAAATPDMAKVRQTQQMAREVARADDAMARMRELPVGWEYAAYDMPGQKGRVDKEVAHFDPEKPPQIPAGPGDAGFMRWQEIKPKYEAVAQARATLAARNPSLVVLSGDAKENAAFASASPQEAAAKLREVLARTLKNIEETEPKIDTGDLDWRDLVPIHQQLYGGLPSESGTQWKETLYQGVAKDVIGDYEAQQFWITLGLGTLAAAAFIISEIATGGMATFLWAAAGAAISAGTAAMSWERYEDLATAAGSTATAQTRLVGEGQVTEAAIAAVIDTAFAFLDAAAAVKGVAAAVRATAAREALGKLAQLGEKEAREAIEAAVKEIGPQETIRRSGKTAEELAGIVGRESEAGKALQGAASDVAVLNPPAQGGAAGATAADITPAARKLAGRLQGLFDRWAQLTPTERLTQLVQEVNADFAHTGMPPLMPLNWTASGGVRGQMTIAQWELAVGSEALTRSTVTVEEFAKLVNTARHEAEHGLQWFRMAQLEAAGGKSAREIAQKLGIPEQVAEAAIEVQNGFRKGEKLIAGSALEAEAKSFFESVYGAGRAERNRVINAVTDAANKLEDASRRFDAVRNLADGDPAKEAARRALDQAAEAKRAAYPAYRALPEEAAAFTAGDVAEAAMRERLELSRRLGVARQAEREAYQAYEPLEKLYVDAATRPKTMLAYDRLLAYHNALDAWKRALDTVEQVERGLSMAAAGKAPR
ncbi:MAG: hypothetical protein AB1416_03845 [Actinomycetota bacterium]